MIPANAVVEDLLSEIVLRRLAEHRFAIGAVYGHEGVGYIAKRIGAFNHAARGGPWIVLADLDSNPCAPGLIGRWLPNGPHPNLILRIAVREVEAWLLADAAAFAQTLGIPAHLVPLQPENLPDPKRTLVDTCRRSRRSELKRDVLPRHPSDAQGPGYNSRIGQFVQSAWRPEAARAAAPSLDRAMRAIESFEWR